MNFVLKESEKLPRKKKDDSIHIRMTFVGELARRFRLIKDYWKLQSNTDMIRTLFTKEFERIKDKGLSPPTPPLEHFNTYNDHATIRDHTLGLYIDIYPRPEGELWCEHCESTKCEHIRFALTEPLKKKGWKHKGEK